MYAARPLTPDIHTTAAWAAAVFLGDTPAAALRGGTLATTLPGDWPSAAGAIKLPGVQITSLMRHAHIAMALSFVLSGTLPGAVPPGGSPGAHWDSQCWRSLLMSAAECGGRSASATDGGGHSASAADGGGRSVSAADGLAPGSSHRGLLAASSIDS